MRKLLLGGLLAFCGALGAFAALETNLTVFVVSNGETLEIGGTQGADPNHNKETNLIDLREGATLQIQDPPNSGKTAYLWSTLFCTNGPATLVLGDATTSLYVRYNFIVRAPGSLVIKSAKCRKFTFGADSSNNGSNNFPHYDLAAITYQDAEGNDVMADTTNEFSIANNNYAQAVLLSLPNPAVTVNVAAGKSLFLAGENMFPNQDVIAFDGKAGHLNVNVFLLHTNVFTSSQKVTLGQWRTIFLKPCKKLDFATTFERVWSATDNLDYDFEISEMHPDAKLAVSSWFGARMLGKVSGSGALFLDLPDNSVSAASTSYFLGDLSAFTGSATLEKANTAVINRDSIDGVTTLYHRSTLKFLSPAEGGQEEASVAKLSLFTDAPQPATVVAAAGQKVTIQTVDVMSGGFLKLVGDPESETDAIDIVDGGTNCVYLLSDGSVAVTFNGEALPNKAVFSQSAAGTACFLPNADGEVFIPDGFAMPSSSDPWYYVLGEVRVTHVPEGYGLKPFDAETSPALTLGTDAPVFAGVANEATVTLAPKPFAWQDKALLWLDPSDANTVYKHYHSETSPGVFNPKYVLTVSASVGGGGESGESVEGLADKRGAAKTTMRAWNARSFQNFVKTGYEDLADVHPFLSTAHATNGKAYLSFGTSTKLRRLQFVNFKPGVNITNASHTTISPKFAVMVYGSHNGGGYTMLGTAAAEGFYARGGNTLNDPITKADVDVWMNGKKVDLATDRFSGEWDVISIDLSKGPAITTLGMDGQDYGTLKYPTGMNYGEMIFFSEVLTDEQRIEVERYLAAGWGLEGKYVDVPFGGKARLAGSGTVEVAEKTAAEVSGTFAGTLNLGAGSVVTLLQDGFRPYTEAQIRALNPTLWIDPSLEGVLTLNNVNQITWLWQHDADRRTDADVALAASGTGRAPIALKGARAFGPELTWIDFNGTNETASSNNGNTLRMYTQKTATTDQKVSMQTGFIVQDSVRGGGTPFLDHIQASGTVKSRVTGNPSDPIYADGTTTVLTNSLVYLNDKAVDYTKGFTGGPEVFAFTASASFQVGYFAYFGNSQGANTGKYGEIQSEILLFDAVLDDAARHGINAYLMSKWLGYAPEGFVDFSAAKLDGEGTFTCADAAGAPKLAATFAGSMTVTGESAELKTKIVTVNKVSTVEGAWVAPEATLSLPAAVTVTVEAVGKPRPGKYTLVDVKGDLSATTFTLAGSLAAIRPDATLKKDGNTLVLDIPDRGLMLLIR